jgi:hypothetical protein
VIPQVEGKRDRPDRAICERACLVSFTALSGWAFRIFRLVASQLTPSLASSILDRATQIVSARRRPVTAVAADFRSPDRRASQSPARPQAAQQAIGFSQEEMNTLSATARSSPSLLWPEHPKRTFLRPAQLDRDGR